MNKSVFTQVADAIFIKTGIYTRLIFNTRKNYWFLKQIFLFCQIGKCLLSFDFVIYYVEE